MHARVTLANQLRSELERFWPGAIRIFFEIDSPIALAFLARYPSPLEARTLGHRRLAALFARQHYCGGRSPDQLLARLRCARSSNRSRSSPARSPTPPNSIAIAAWPASAASASAFG